MEEKKKLKFLFDAFEKYNISKDDPFVRDFFLRTRNHSDMVSDNGDGKVYSYAPIKPIKKIVHPLNFENSGYGSSSNSNLLESYLYENMEENPLVWENVGKDDQWVKESFEQRRKEYGPIKQSASGKLYNGADANHRLLTLIINEFLAMYSAKNSEERSNIFEKYKMELEVDLPHNKKLCDLLEERLLQVEPEFSHSSFPKLVREYRQETLRQVGEKDYVAEFDPKNALYFVNFNNEKFVGNEEQTIKYLEEQKDLSKPMMKWKAGEYFYASCMNFVVKSKEETVVQDQIERFDQLFIQGKIKELPILIEQDMDTQKYMLMTPSFKLSKKEEKKAVGKAILETINSNDGLVELAINNKIDLDAIYAEAQEATEDPPYDALFNSVCFKNLDREDCKLVKDACLEIYRQKKYESQPGECD